MKRFSILYAILLIILLPGGCESDGSFENKLYIKSNTKVGEILVKGDTGDEERIIRAELAMPAPEDIHIKWVADASLVKQYNMAYYDEAEMLPGEQYEWLESTALINSGNVLSTDATIRFRDLSALDREQVYVLPVTISETNIEVLKSARTYYYVIKGAALINVVADMEENYLSVNWKNPAVCNNLSQLTMEVLIRVREFDKMISTVMGIEGRFLIRIGDAGFPSNQIQVATNRGNFPGADSNKGLPTNEWVHVALTYDAASSSLIVYVDGRKQSEGTLSAGNVSLGATDFYIGRSYDNNRWLSGEIAECRIWNIVRSQEEIAANPLFVDSASEGLVAYWKCNDGAGNLVKDHTVNGNDAIASETLKWTPVSLPEAGK